MRNLRVILILAVLLVFSAVATSGIGYAQDSTALPSGNTDLSFIDNTNMPICQDNAANGLPVAPAYVDEAASGQSIIFNNGVPTAVIGADGAQTAYNPAMFDYLAGYMASDYGVGISHNPNVPSDGTWKQEAESGTLGTQEPNLNLN